MLTESEAWKEMQKWITPYHRLGLCILIARLRALRAITPDMRDVMWAKVEAEKYRLHNVDEVSAYIWPFGLDGQKQRHAFCDRMILELKGDIDAKDDN